ncbi:thiol-disulfide oxidoreductase DCC family protein [Priestia aryabhattai]|uniref:thiol-disulfide oxidoreductase DCC family protein n=1 Tax=Priestia aryabhattai TaxID=412384 RepID=UPI00311D764C
MLPNPSHHPIILFDGVCNLCNGWVQFVIKRDPRALFRFASLRSDNAGILLRKHNYEDPPLQSVILLMNGNLYTESTAILHIVRRLRGPIQLMTCF